MVATVPGEKLLIETQLQFFSLLHCELRLIIDVTDVILWATFFTYLLTHVHNVTSHSVS